MFGVPERQYKIQPFKVYAAAFGVDCDELHLTKCENTKRRKERADPE
jgi:hypothetical protein